jgi:hypothetical protein
MDVVRREMEEECSREASRYFADQRACGFRVVEKVAAWSVDLMSRAAREIDRMQFSPPELRHPVPGRGVREMRSAKEQMRDIADLEAGIHFAMELESRQEAEPVRGARTREQALLLRKSLDESGVEVERLLTLGDVAYRLRKLKWQAGPGV